MELPNLSGESLLYTATTCCIIDSCMIQRRLFADDEECMVTYQDVEESLPSSTFAAPVENSLGSFTMIVLHRPLHT